MFDLAIIGGGPAGYVAAERAGALGMSVVLFEARELGGVCLNEGCIPTKTLLYGAKVYDTALSGAKYGVAAEAVSFDYARMVDRKNKVVRKLVAGVGMKMRGANVEVVKGRAAILPSETSQGIEIECDNTKYAAKNLLVCTGSQPFVPPIEGLAQALEAGTAVTARELLATKERPESLAVIGGGVIGMEFASLFCSLGSQVTVIEMLPEILGGLDDELAAMLREVYAKKGVAFHLGCKVTRVEGESVYFLDSERIENTIDAARILVSVGRRAVSEGFGLETLGIELERGGIRVDAGMRTSVPHVYAAGDVTGFSMLAHTASREAEVAVANIAGGNETMNYTAIPGIVYTNPEVACVGMTLQEAQKQGVAARELKLPMAFSGRFVAENEAGNGLCKVVVNAQDQVIGVHMLGNPSSEIIWGAGLAIEQKMSLEQLEKIVFPHPTVAEIIKETLGQHG